MVFGVAVASVYEVPACSTSCTPSRKTRYPVTPTLSVAPLHETLILLVLTAVAVTVVGACRRLGVSRTGREVVGLDVEGAPHLVGRRDRDLATVDGHLGEAEDVVERQPSRRRAAVRTTGTDGVRVEAAASTDGAHRGAAVAEHVADESSRVRLVALVAMRVPVEHDGNAVLIEQSLQCPGPALQERVRGLATGVGVQRVVPESELQRVRMCRQIGLQPLVFCAVRASSAASRSFW